MDAQTIYRILIEIWCREHGQKLTKLEIKEKKHEAEADGVSA